jgi:hypothetical protein
VTHVGKPRRAGGVEPFHEPGPTDVEFVAQQPGPPPMSRMRRTAGASVSRNSSIQSMVSSRKLMNTSPRSSVSAAYAAQSFSSR